QKKPRHGNNLNIKLPVLICLVCMTTLHSTAQARHLRRTRCGKGRDCFLLIPRPSYRKLNHPLPSKSSVYELIPFLGKEAESCHAPFRRPKLMDLSLQSLVLNMTGDDMRKKLKGIPHLQVLHPQIQPTMDQKILKNKIPKSVSTDTNSMAKAPLYTEKGPVARVLSPLQLLQWKSSVSYVFHGVSFGCPKDETHCITREPDCTFRKLQWSQVDKNVSSFYMFSGVRISTPVIFLLKNLSTLY
uniref:Uncharacterized protein n=1 Tax=Sus scrofa TaxID=9823 RepID=A0A8D1DNJ5_PIG